MQNEDRNFKGQDLRGQSFKGQDLTGADFSDCDLRGVDFSFANLTDAKFCNAKMGRTFIDELMLWASQSILAMIASITAMFSMIFIFAIVETFFVKYINSDIAHIAFSVIYIILFIGITLVAISRNKINYVLFFLIPITAIALVKSLTINELTMINFINDLVESGFGGVIGSLSAALVSVIIIAISEYITGYAALAMIAFFTMQIMKAGNSGLGIIIGISISSSFILFGMYLGWRSNQKEEPQLLLLHRLSLRMACGNSTQFLEANLNGADFTGADLKHARFGKAKISNCNFQQAKNHHLALTDDTPIEKRKIRDLIVDGIVFDKNFSNLNLYGLVFSGLSLEGFDFSYSNLCGANLSNTRMTGAILECWNIDTETCLDNIDCKYYYYLENGEKKRMPPEGKEYKEGEFTRIFQKIANTIDFIAHNEMELAAIRLSVEQVRVESGNDDICVQAIEEKDGIIIIKVKASKTEDRGVLYHEVNRLKQEYEFKIKALMDEKKERINSIENLKEKLTKQREELISTIRLSTIIDSSPINGMIKGD